MLNLSAEQVENTLSLNEIIEAVKKGIINCELGHYEVPTRLHLEKNGNTNLVMPALGSKYFCTKLVSVVPNNPQRGLPMIVGTVVLSLVETGETIALLDAPMITALRTAAVGTIGLDLITQQNIRKIGIIGLGVQGIWQTIFAKAVRPIQQVFCYARTKAKFDFYQKKVLEKWPNLEIIWCHSADEVVAQAEVIYGCTTSATPIFSNEKQLVLNKRFISVGSFRPSMQELPNIVYESAHSLMIDTAAATHEVGDVINALNDGLIQKKNLFSIGEVLTRKRTMVPQESTVFKSVGMAAFDLALASAIYETKIRENATHTRLIHR